MLGSDSAGTTTGAEGDQMKLIKVDIRGFRRLADVSINLDTPVVALVGPNEAGKTSILRSLMELEREGAVARPDRSRIVDDQDVEIRSHWLLEPADKAELASRPECEGVRYFRFYKSKGQFRSDAYPFPVRNRRPRERAEAAFAKASRQRVWADAIADDPGLAEVGERLTTVLGSTAETLQPADIEFLQAAADQLESSLASTATAARVVDSVRTLAQVESVEHPRAFARRTLLARRPRFVWFDEESRSLSTDYDLSDLDADIPKALANLARAASLDLSELVEQVSRGDHPQAERTIQTANQRLRETFSEAWTRSGLVVHLSRDGWSLLVMIEEAELAFTDIAERSDGLRMFVALFTFLAQLESDVPPVLLIDEAEQHLHYDAQADLVRVLTAQASTSKVIYTTHSAGCLPEDMGAPIRVVYQIPGTETSLVRSGFWHDSVGFDSLLLAMGASTFAFSKASFAVLAEGPVENILLPRLLREAMGVGHLGFLVAPGLSHVAKSEFTDVDLVAARVVFVVDNDAEGHRLKARLERSGVPAGKVVVAALPPHRFNTLEDFLEPSVYLEAVNEELRRSGFDEGLALSAVSEPMRPRSVDAACKRKRISPPNKGAVARRLVEMDSDRSLLSREGKGALALVGQALADGLGVPPRSRQATAG